MHIWFALELYASICSTLDFYDISMHIYKKCFVYPAKKLETIGIDMLTILQ